MHEPTRCDSGPPLVTEFFGGESGRSRMLQQARTNGLASASPHSHVAGRYRLAAHNEDDDATL